MICQSKYICVPHLYRAQRRRHCRGVRSGGRDECCATQRAGAAEGDGAANAPESDATQAGAHDTGANAASTLEATLGDVAPATTVNMEAQADNSSVLATGPLSSDHPLSRLVCGTAKMRRLQRASSRLFVGPFLILLPSARADGSGHHRMTPLGETVIDDSAPDEDA